MKEVYECAYGPERIKRVSLSINDLKRSDFLKHLGIKNCEKAFLEFRESALKYTTFRSSRASLSNEKERI